MSNEAMELRVKYEQLFTMFDKELDLIFDKFDTDKIILMCEKVHWDYYKNTISEGKKQTDTESKCNKHIVSNSEATVCTCKKEKTTLSEKMYKYCDDCRLPMQTDC